MESSKINAFFIFRILVLTLFASLLVSSFLQLNFPTLKETENSINTVWIKRQMDITGNNNARLVQHGWTYYQLGLFSEAKALMERAYEVDNSISALYGLGLIDLKYRRLGEGITKLEKVSEFSPNHVPTLMALGESYYQQHYYVRAKDLFEKAVNCEPTSTKARLWLGRTYINLDEITKARQVLSTVNSGPEAQEAVALVKNI